MTTTLAIEGMHCAACAERLHAAFMSVPGVTAARVTLDPPSAIIESDREIPVDELNRAAHEAGNYSVRQLADASSPVSRKNAPPDAQPSLFPLFLIVGFIAGVTALTSFVRTGSGWRAFMNDFMAGFFLVFSFFKLLDLHGFARAFAMYDVLARRARAYALAYPFIELALGVAYLLRWRPVVTNSVTLVLMLLGSVGVLQSVLNKRAIRCACLGTALNLPMTTVTLVEDVGMAAMAAIALVAGM